MGACAGLTIGRAMINDSFSKEKAAHFYLIIFPFVGMSPALAPLIGGVLIQHFSWQSCFVFLLIFIVLTFLLCLFILPETLPDCARHKFCYNLWAKNIKSVLSNKDFIIYASVPCFAYAAYFSYLVESPFMLPKLGLDKYYIGYSYILLSLGYLLGNLSAKIIIKNKSSLYALYFGYSIFLTGAALFVLQMFIGYFGWLSTIICISILTFENGFLLPIGTSASISSHPEGLGSASGVVGALQLASASFAAFFVGKVTAHEHIVLYVSYWFYYFYND